MASQRESANLAALRAGKTGRHSRGPDLLIVLNRSVPRIQIITTLNQPGSKDEMKLTYVPHCGRELTLISGA
jgi:hypothetical protein